MSETGRTAEEIVKAVEAKSVRMGALGPYTIRAVTCLSISSEDIEVALEVMRDVLKAFVELRHGKEGEEALTRAQI